MSTPHNNGPYDGNQGSGNGSPWSRPGHQPRGQQPVPPPPPPHAPGPPPPPPAYAPGPPPQGFAPGPPDAGSPGSPFAGYAPAPTPAYAPGPWPPPGPPMPPGPPRRGPGLMIGLVVALVVALVAGAVTVLVLRDDDGGGEPAAAASTPAAAASTPAAADAPARVTPATPTAGSPDASPTGPGGCREPGPGSPSVKRFAAEPPMTIDTGAAYRLELHTTCGTITVDLDAAAAPRTVNSLAFLAGEGYFDHSPCHRITTAGIYVLQCGDPTGTGRGTPGYEFPDENLAGATYPAGTLAMANAGPGTNGSQFFLVWRDTQLPPSYTPFGHVTEGMDVLRAIAGAGTSSPSGDGPPRARVVVEQAVVTKD